MATTKDLNTEVVTNETKIEDAVIVAKNRQPCNTLSKALLALAIGSGTLLASAASASAASSGTTKSFCKAVKTETNQSGVFNHGFDLAYAMTLGDTAASWSAQQPTMEKDAVGLVNLDKKELASDRGIPKKYRAIITRDMAFWTSMDSDVTSATSEQQFSPERNGLLNPAFRKQQEADLTAFDKYTEKLCHIG
jgi:hypothetical protein